MKNEDEHAWCSESLCLSILLMYYVYKTTGRLNKLLNAVKKKLCKMLEDYLYRQDFD